MRTKKLCFVDYTMETCAQIKALIDDYYNMAELPTKPELKYTRFDGSKVIVKLSKSQHNFTEQQKDECFDAFGIFMLGEDDRIRDEVGKLVAVSGASLPGREDQLHILREVFNNNQNS